MEKLFALLSGEHPTLPAAEVKAILEAEGHPFRLVEAAPCLLRFEAPSRAAAPIAWRAAYTRTCGLEIFRCKASAGEVLREASRAPLEDYISPGETFAVRVRRVCGATWEGSILQLERSLGAAVLSRVGNVKVDLSKPGKLFLGLILHGGGFLFGVTSVGFPDKGFSRRTPTRKPFTHPSTLQPKLARCMVNLSRVRRGGVLFDPFCGTGTILLEASAIGVEAVGGDLQPKMAYGSLLNLKHYRAQEAHVMVADAARPPLRQVDAVATDPPYGRSATTAGRRLHELLEDFLSAVGGILRRDGCVCMASPLQVELPRLAESSGFKVLEEHMIRVHKSLTRRLTVLSWKG